MILFEEAERKVLEILLDEENWAKRFNSFKYLPDIIIGDKELKGSDEEKIKLVISHVEEHEYCWKFYWDNKVFIQTKHPDYQMLPILPLLVDKENGDIYITSINYPKGNIEDFIDYKLNRKYEYDWNKRKREKTLR